MHKVSVFYTRLLATLSFFLFPFVYFFIWLRGKNKKPGGKLKIIVIPQLTRIGDIVCSTPVFRAIKEKYPDSHLSVIVSDKAAGIVKNNSRIDELIIIEEYRKNFLGLIKKIRDEKYDWGFSLSGTALSSVIFFYGLVLNRVKITRYDRPIMEKITDWMADRKERYAHHTYLPGFYLYMLRHLGIRNFREKKEVFGNKASDKKVDDFFINNGLSGAGNVVGISITAGNKIKEWGDKKFEELAREINKRYKAKIIFIGAPGDKKRIDAVLKNLNNDLVFLDGVRFNIEDLPSLIKKLSLFIAVDTGLIYIAHALGVPLIDIIGPVDPKEQPPLDEKSFQVRPALVSPSSFVFKEAGSHEEHLKALEAISVNDVMNAVSNIIKE